MQGGLGLLQIQGQHQLMKRGKMQRKIDRIEQAILSFFKDLKDKLESIEGLDLTDRGDEVVGAGLCMMLSSSAENTSSDDDDAEEYEAHTDDDEMGCESNEDNDEIQQQKKKQRVSLQ
jgi:hypothetical protein